ncbi:alpha/beta hydrolase family protein [Anditalea andensis]|nr:alpha/beta hydrolase [Anditalea andensis]
MNYISKLIILFSLLPCLVQGQEYNYLEMNVPEFELPDLFTDLKGNEIKTVKDWESIRRPEIMKLLGDQVYGHVRDYDEISFYLEDKEKNPLPEKATFKQIAITVRQDSRQYTFHLDLFIPNTDTGPYPVFLMITHRNKGRIENEYDLGSWPVETVIDAGYAMAAFHVSEVTPDNRSLYQEGILKQLYPDELEKSNGMRALSSWAWGAMRVMDYFEQDEDIDANRSAVVGHSRAGKAALWTGANDPRWAITISNQSGAGGAALSKRKFGETVKKLNSSFPHWFTDNFNAYSDKEENLPLDQHFLIGAIAPRAVYVGSAKLDQWSDPKGEFLGLKLGTEVHSKIYKQDIALSEDFISVTTPEIHKHAGYHLRMGKHSFTTYDWERFIEFADKQFK